MTSIRDIHPTRMIVHMENLRYNIKSLREHGSNNIMGVIKNNAYSHGAIQIARVFQEEGIDYLAVARIDEAIELRRAGLDCKILILGYSPKYLYEKLVQLDICQTIFSLEDAIRLDKVAAKLGLKASCHIKVDTGMSRLGFLTNDKSLEEISYMASLKNLELEGIYSHFSQSEIKDKSYSQKQYQSFMDFCQSLEDKSISFKYRHISNAAAAIDMPEYNLDLVRLGIPLFGVYPNYELESHKLDLKLSFSLLSEVAQVKILDKDTPVSYNNSFICQGQTKVAVIPIGYADGYYQELADSIGMFINNRRVRVLGRVCMDQTIVDITGMDVKPGDLVTVIDHRSQDRLSARAMSHIAPRVARVYMEGGRVKEIINPLID